MDTLLELARRLGERIAAHERTTQLKTAQNAVDADPDALQLIKDYEQQAHKIQQLEQQQKPVEVDDKHRLRDLEERISTNEKLKNLSRRQVDFVDMMRRIKQTIDNQLEL